MEEIKSLKNHVADFKCVICDLWGVIHNGNIVFPAAMTALKSLRKMGLFVILLSNSPRTSKTVEAQLEHLGFNADGYDDIVTSGDLATEFMKKCMAGMNFFHIGPERDRSMVNLLPNQETKNCNRADVILCTGYFEDKEFELSIYEELFKVQIGRKVPFVCANPDREVNMGAKRVLCAGSLAAYYEKLGGKTYWLGKPEAVAYEKCVKLAQAKTRLRFDRDDFIAIGDNLFTDIKGAKNYGIQNIFIAEGLHNHVGTNLYALEALFAETKIRPDAWMRRLEWN